MGAGSGDILSGTMSVGAVNGCYVVATGTVTTADTGSPVTFAVNIWDDGDFVAGYPISAPGDGHLHDFCAVHQVTQPIQQTAPGVGRRSLPAQPIPALRLSTTTVVSSRGKRVRRCRRQSSKSAARMRSAVRHETVRRRSPRRGKP